MRIAQLEQLTQAAITEMFEHEPRLFGTFLLGLTAAYRHTSHLSASLFQKVLRVISVHAIIECADPNYIEEVFEDMLGDEVRGLLAAEQVKLNALPPHGQPFAWPALLLWFVYACALTS